MVSILIILYSFLFPQTRSEFGAEVNVFTALDVRPGTFRYFHSPGMNFHPCLATGDWTLQTRGDCEMVDWEDNIGYCCLGSNGDGFISLLTGSGEHLASMQHYWREERREGILRGEVSSSHLNHAAARLISEKYLIQKYLQSLRPVSTISDHQSPEYIQTSNGSSIFGDLECTLRNNQRNNISLFSS